MMRLIQYPQEVSGENIEKLIIDLENTAWKQGENEDDKSFPSAANTYITSFVLLDCCYAVSHVAVRKSLLLHNGQEYLAYGLSEVVTRPEYQKMGLGLMMIQKAAEFIISQSPDLSVFTCEPIRVGFYTKGGWAAANGGYFVGGSKTNPFRSDSLGLVTMIRFHSEKAMRNKHEFENTDITFELGENQLW